MAERTALASWVEIAKGLVRELRSTEPVALGTPLSDVLVNRTELLWNLSGRIEEALPPPEVQCEYDELMAAMAQLLNAEHDFLTSAAVHQSAAK